MSDAPSPTVAPDGTTVTATPPMLAVDAVTVAHAKRALPYAIRSATAPVAGGGIIGHGVNLKSESQDASNPARFFIFQEGRTQQALSDNSVAALLYHGILPRADVYGLLDAADTAAGIAPEVRLTVAALDARIAEATAAAVAAAVAAARAEVAAAAKIAADEVKPTK